MKFLKAVFNFFVGDWIILIGVAVLLVVIALLEQTTHQDLLAGFLMIAGLIAILAFTLRREVKPKS